MVTLGINQKDQANDYLLELAKSDPAGFRKIISRLRVVAEQQTVENKLTYRHVGEQVFEVKIRSGLRLYTFPDIIQGFSHQLVIAVCGGKKGNKKEQQADIARAILLKRQYLAAKQSRTTTLTLIPLEHEHQD